MTLVWSEDVLPDVLVVGGGPAGSALARILAGRGWSVIVVDRARFPRPKPCGECVNPGGVAALERLGMLDEVLKLRPAFLRGWRVRSGSARDAGEAVGTFQPGAEAGLGVPREDLDHVLLCGAREMGARIHEGVKVDAVRPGRALRSGGATRADPATRMFGAARAGGAIRSSGSIGAGGRTDRLPAIRIGRGGSGLSGWRSARVVVGADGLRSVVARSLGAYRRRPRIRKVSLTVRLRGVGPSRDRGLLVLEDDRVVGLAPVHAEQGLWNATVVVRAGKASHDLSRDPGRFVRDALSSIELAPGGSELVVSGSVGPESVGPDSVGRSAGPGWNEEPEIIGGPWASGPFDWPTGRTAGPGVVLVGDAAGYYDPLTGQGIFRALRSAELAAEAIDEYLRAPADGSEGAPGGTPVAFVSYEKKLRRAFRRGRCLQKLIEAVVSRRRLRRPLIGRFAGAPGAFSSFIRVTGDAASPLSLLEPRAWTGLVSTQREANADMTKQETLADHR